MSAGKATVKRSNRCDVCRGDRGVLTQKLPQWLTRGVIDTALMRWTDTSLCIVCRANAAQALLDRQVTA